MSKISGASGKRERERQKEIMRKMAATEADKEECKGEGKMKLATLVAGYVSW